MSSLLLINEIEEKWYCIQIPHQETSCWFNFEEYFWIFLIHHQKCSHPTSLKAFWTSVSSIFSLQAFIALWYLFFICWKHLFLSYYFMVPFNQLEKLADLQWLFRFSLLWKYQIPIFIPREELFLQNRQSHFQTDHRFEIFRSFWLPSSLLINV